MARSAGRRAALAAVAIGLAILVGACGSHSAGSTSAPTTTVDPAIARARAAEAKSRAERAKAEAQKLEAEAAKAKAEAARARAEADQARSSADQARSAAEQQSSPGSAPGTPVTGTPCQRLFASGAPFEVAFQHWIEAGAPPSWDADHDGIPCEKSYGEQN
ncbi:MAG TPA: hypothetical protein VGJ54_15060 [Streptosporangiaceae bacterium]